MPLSPLAGKPAPADLLIDVERLVSAYYTRKPDAGDPQQLVSFGTSGHRRGQLPATDGTVWTTDKDGLIMGLLAAEITASTDKDPGEHYEELTAQFGKPCYTRIDAPASPKQKAALQSLSSEAVKARELGGEPIIAKLTRAPGNGAPIGGLKVITANGWFAARPSGTENVYKLYAESFRGHTHLDAIIEEAQKIVDRTLAEAAI